MDEYEFLLAPLIFTLVSFFTRMYKIGLSPIVTWDEAQYVNDLHCPNFLFSQNTILIALPALVNSGLTT